jgi:hypothetical protein
MSICSAHHERVAGCEPCAVVLEVPAYSLTVRVPQLVAKGSAPNGREHWAAKARRVKGERFQVRLVLSQYIPPYCGHDVAVTVVRCAPRPLRDDDNLTASAKAVRDEIARWLGSDDSDSRIEWRVEQRKSTRKDQGTVIRIESKVRSAPEAVGVVKGWEKL